MQQQPPQEAALPVTMAPPSAKSQEEAPRPKLKLKLSRPKPPDAAPAPTAPEPPRPASASPATAAMPVDAALRPPKKARPQSDRPQSDSPAPLSTLLAASSSSSSSSSSIRSVSRPESDGACPATGTWVDEARRVLERVKRHEWVNLAKDKGALYCFMRPVAEAFPGVATDYARVIAAPMDLGTLEAMLLSPRCAFEGPRAFVEAAARVFANTIEYNYGQGAGAEVPLELCAAAAHLGQWVHDLVRGIW